MRPHLRGIGQLWARALPAGALLASALVLGQVAGGLDHPAPSELVTETATDLTPSK